jgi:hypothetical protein
MGWLGGAATACADADTANRAGNGREVKIARAARLMHLEENRYSLLLDKQGDRSMLAVIFALRRRPAVRDEYLGAPDHHCVPRRIRDHGRLAQPDAERPV